MAYHKHDTPKVTERTQHCTVVVSGSQISNVVLCDFFVKVESNKVHLLKYYISVQLWGVFTFYVTLYIPIN